MRYRLALLTGNLTPPQNHVRPRVIAASCMLATPLGAWAATLLYGDGRWSYLRWLAAAGVTGLVVAGLGLAWRRGRINRRPVGRRDLHGVVLELDHVATLALLPGQDATLRVESLHPTEDPDWVLVAGAWCGPDGDDDHARVEVRTRSLPQPKVGAE